MYESLSGPSAVAVLRVDEYSLLDSNKWVAIDFSKHVKARRILCS